MNCRMPAYLTVPHPMGLVYAELEVHREGGPACNVRFLVDSGATLSLLPWRAWPPLGLKPLRSMVFSLADGTTIRRRISDCRFRFRGIEAPSPVILGRSSRPGSKPFRAHAPADANDARRGGLIPASAIPDQPGTVVQNAGRFSKRAR